MEMLLVAALVGLAIGLSLGLLGAGGSILAVPAMVYLLGQSPSQATTGSLVVVGVTAAAAALSLARQGVLHVKPGVTFGLLAVVGAAVGSTAALRVPDAVLLAAFAALLVVAAIAMALRQRSKRADTERSSAQPENRARGWAAVVAAASAVGMVTGFLGVGGGFLIVPALVVLLGVPIREAAGTSLIAITITSGAALVVRTVDGSSHPQWSAVLVLTLAAVGAAIGGTRLAQRVNTARLTGAFVGLLLAVASYTAVDVVLRVA